MHVSIWSERTFNLRYDLPFKQPGLRLQPVSDGWKSESDNGYSKFCLKPHNSAQNLFAYILGPGNFRPDCLRAAGRHFYAASRDTDTSTLRLLFRRFCSITETVKRSTEQLGTVLARLEADQKKAESVKQFISELFGFSRDDDARGRSKKNKLPRLRSSETGRAMFEEQRSGFLFYQYNYSPFFEREINEIVSGLSRFGPKFQARLLPKLLYDMVWHAWTKDPCSTLPPMPLKDFYSADFFGLADRDISHLLPPNPECEAERQRLSSILEN